MYLIIEVLIVLFCVFQVYKATADVKNGRAMFERYSAVMDNEKPHFLSLREIVLKRKQPRKMFVQCNTFIEGC